MYTVVLAWLAGLFAVMAATLTLAAVVVGWPALLIAAPMAGVAALFWYHATGRLTERLRQQVRQGATTTRQTGRRRRAATTGAGPRWADPRRSRSGARRGATGAAGRRGAAGAGTSGRASPGRTRPDTGMSPDRARGILGVRSGADADAIRSAYRRKVKETHPDRGGSAEAFQRVTEAYETLDQSN